MQSLSSELVFLRSLVFSRKERSGKNICHLLFPSYALQASFYLLIYDKLLLRAVCRITYTWFNKEIIWLTSGTIVSRWIFRFFTLRLKKNHYYSWLGTVITNSEFSFRVCNNEENIIFAAIIFSGDNRHVTKRGANANSDYAFIYPFL